MTVYATRLVNGTDSMERMRRADAMTLHPAGVGLARAGFRNDGGGVVTVNDGTMNVSVTPFTAWVDGGVSDVQGGYTFVSDATETLTLSPGHASLSRTDVVIAEVRDTVHDGSGSTDARVRILEGTPGSGTPALPTNALALRELNIPAGLSAGTGGLASSNLGTDRRKYTTGLGGVLTVASQAERDALPQINGTEVYRTDTDALEVLRAGTWEAVPAAIDLPQRVAAGAVLLNYNGAQSTSAAITFPPEWATIGGTVVLTATHVDDANYARFTASVTAVTTSGATVSGYFKDGATPAGYASTVHWVAVLT